MIRVLRLTGVLFYTLLLIWPLNGCGSNQTSGSTASSDPSSKPSSADLSQSNVEKAPQLSTESSKMPLEDTTYEISEQKNYEKIGAQFFLNNDLAYRIANAIYRYRDYHNALIFDQQLSNIMQADAAVLVEIAASQAPHIDLYSSDFCSLSPDSTLGRFCKTIRQGGNTIGLLSYGEDVRTTAEELFGADYELPQENGLTIQYNSELDLYYLNRTATSLATDYPVIVSESGTLQNHSVLSAQVLRLCYWDFNGIWSTPDGSWESGNMDMQQIKSYVLKQMKAGNPQFQPSTYYLQEQDGILRVVGYQIS